LKTSRCQLIKLCRQLCIKQIKIIRIIRFRVLWRIWLRMTSKENTKQAWSIILWATRRSLHTLSVTPWIINYFSGTRMWSFAHERMPLRPLAAANLRKIIRKLPLLIWGSPNDTQQPEMRGNSNVWEKCSRLSILAWRETSLPQQRIVPLN